MTHVLMTADTVGGVWTYALELADALAPMGVSVSLATMGRPMDRDQHVAVGASAVVDVHESSYRLEWMKGPWREVDQAAEWLLRLEDSERPDVVHLNGYAHGALPWSAPSVVVGHSCVLSWWTAVHGGPAPAEWDRYRQRVAQGLRGATRVVAPSQAMLSELRRWYGFDGGVVIPNGRRSDWSSPQSKEPMVLGTGRLWDEAKNLDALRRVAPSLPWPVVIAGDAEPPEGTPVPAMETAGGPARLLGRLTFPDLAPWLDRAEIFALPAWYEPFGLGALEAGIAGCALVLGDIPSLREVWGSAACYVGPGYDSSLLAALRDLMAEPALVRRLGHAARERALELSAERFAASYRDLYRELLVTAGAGATAFGGHR
ncbi:MAG TPA: glycosyltransferase family 4 protein [Acidimicrobiales bacterium]|nr:glycosyltransferase family 4 protein [Acidimicrobiales bacterium]